MKKILSVIAFAALALGFNAAYAQQTIPVKEVYAEQYNNWSIASQQANTYVFNANCQNSPLTDGGIAPPYFVFGQPTPSPVFWPVLIQDADPTKSEIVTPTSLSTVSGACGFSAAPANAHTSFTVLSGTAGLQDAVGSLGNVANPARPINVFLDRNWYTLVAALPGPPSVYSIIAALKGSAGVNVVDTTTAPFTYWRWNGANYVNNGGAVPPTLTAGTGAGTGPTLGLVKGNGLSGQFTLTTGTSPTASATIVTLTWPTVANGGFNHTPACTVVGSYTVGTVTYGAANPETAVVPATGTALTAATTYTFFYDCK